MSELNDKPLVTFALFAYNQEKYIREAIEGAFAQDYSPLEIILSDDCSSDRTFEIMQDMASIYNGPHVVRTRRSVHNLGIGRHVFEVQNMAKGKIFVLAAGDDISISSRAQIMQLAFHNNADCYAVVSSVRHIETNEVHHCNAPQDIKSLLTRKKYIVGATAAYKTNIFTDFRPFIAGVHHEDDALALRALILGSGIFEISEPLVLYRSVGGVSENTRNSASDSFYILRSMRDINNRLIMLKQWQLDLIDSDMSDMTVYFKSLHTELVLLKCLVKRRRIGIKFINACRKRIGIKATVFHVLGHRMPIVLNFYLSIRRYWKK